MPDDLLTPQEIAAMLGLSPRAVLLWLKAGKLRGFHSGPRGRWRVHRADLDSFIRYNQEAQAPTTQDPKAKGLAVAC